MKKIGIFSLITVALMIAGCGGSNNSNTGKITGTIVNLSDNPIAGIVVKIGTRTTTSQGDGSFTFTSVPKGTYTVTANGGTPDTGDTSGSPGTGHLTATVTKTVSSGTNDFGQIKVYNILGYGVISKSTSAILSSSITGMENKFLKDTITKEPSFTQSGRMLPNKTLQLRATTDFWDLNPRFIYLKWTPLTEVWVSHYQIKYLGTTGTLADLVWNSDDTHDGDPDFVLTNPKAYLDIADELDGMVNAPGEYQFRITGYNADETQSTELPIITVSIGKLMNTFPELTRDADLLSWTAVSGADEYAVGIYMNSITVANELWHNTTAALSITMDSSGLTSGDTCCWSLNAHAPDGTGWTAEIINTTAQFIY